MKDLSTANLVKHKM